MSQNKVIIVILLIFVGLFVVLMLGGTLSNDQPHSGNNKEATNLSKQKDFTAWKTWFEKSLAWLRPKAKLPCGQGEEISEKCENLQLKASFPILPDDSQSFRTAKFRLVSGSANICYRVNENAPSCDEAKNRGENDKPNFEAQSFDLPDSDADDPRRSAIVVLKKGGKITVICKSIPCQVDLE